MAINKQSSIVLIVIILYSLRLDLLGRSKTDTYKTSLKVTSVSLLMTFDKSPPNYYLLSRIIYLSIMFFWYTYKT